MSERLCGAAVATNFSDMRETARTILRITASICLTAHTAHAAEMPSAFFVAKSVNENQVHFASAEQKSFGIDLQEVEGPTVRIVLHGLASRPVVIQTWRDSNGACLAASTMTISGSLRRLYKVFVAIRFFSLDYLELTGWADDGAVVRERIVP